MIHQQETNETRFDPRKVLAEEQSAPPEPLLHRRKFVATLRPHQVPAETLKMQKVDTDRDLAGYFTASGIFDLVAFQISSVSYFRSEE
jgi:hypothetical protein